MKILRGSYEMSSSTESIILYKNHANSIGYWKIWSKENVIHIMHAVTLGGSPVHHTETVHEGKQGRSVLQQVQHRIQSRINKQMDKGYVTTKEEASKPPTNALNFLQPMLAQPLKRVLIDVNKHLVQLKYNGHRCLVTKHEGDIIAYSRQGKLIDTIPHILEKIDIPEGVTLDGELYCHGQSLQTIASWAKRAQEDTKRLMYVVYDVISVESYLDRYEWLKEQKFWNLPIILSPTWHLKNELTDELRRAKNEHYEGLILRNETGGYQPGRRSKFLVKVKSCMDAEYPVVDVIPSKDNWGILVCMLPNGDTFKTSAPGTIAQKKEVLQNKENYIGKDVTVEFAEYTKDNVPFHCVATGWRDDL